MATLALPKAILLVAMSSKTGGCLLVPGMARQIGLVAKRPSEPLYGAT